MSFIDRTKEFFGLAPMDIDSDDAYYADEREPAQSAYATNGSAAYAPRTAPAAHEYEPASSVPTRAPHASYQPIIVPVSLVSYREATKVGAPFRDGDAVVFEVTDAKPGHDKRLIDFAAGLVYAFEGSRMLKLTSGMDTDRLVFAIIPPEVDIDRSELERIAGLR